MMTLYLKNMLLLWLLMLSYGAKNQNINRFFTDSALFAGSEKGALHLRIENNNFIKDDEYFGKLQNGFTYIGFFLRPLVVYYPHRNIKVTAGLNMLKYSGMSTLLSVRPVFRVHYAPSPHFALVMGSLYGNLQHALSDPLYGFNNFFDHNLEEGLQALVSYRHLELDIWLDWLHFADRVSREQERLNGAYHGEYYINGKEAPFRFSVSFQGLAAHRGGQYHAAGQILQTLFNSATGLKVLHRLSGKGQRSWAWGGEALYFGYEDLSGDYQLPYRSGNAKSVALFLQYRQVFIQAGYWRGEKFYAPMGNPLYASISVDNPGFFLPQSELITGKFSWGKKLYKDIYLEFRYEGYWDLKQHLVEHSLGLYLMLKGDYFFKHRSINR